jgi:hypothetical protein
MGFPLDLIWLAVPAYIIMQFVVIWRSSGPFRWIAASPLVVMIPVFVLTGVSYAQESKPLATLALVRKSGGIVLRRRRRLYAASAEALAPAA